jgi:hypothetical protein
VQTNPPPKPVSTEQKLYSLECEPLLLTMLRKGPTTVQKSNLWWLKTLTAQLAQRRTDLPFKFAFGHRAISRCQAAEKVAKPMMSNAITPRSWITNPVTTVRRHRNLFQNRMGLPHTYDNARPNQT